MIEGSLVGLVLGRKCGSEGIEPAGECDGGSCISRSGSGGCLGYRGHLECGEELVIYCQDPKFFKLSPEIRMGMIRSKDRCGEIFDFG